MLLHILLLSQRRGIGLQFLTILVTARPLKIIIICHLDLHFQTYPSVFQNKRYMHAYEIHVCKPIDNEILNPIFCIIFSLGRCELHISVFCSDLSTELWLLYYLKVTTLLVCLFAYAGALCPSQQLWSCRDFYQTLGWHDSQYVLENITTWVNS